VAGVATRRHDSRFIVGGGVDQNLIAGLVNARHFAEARQLNRRFGRMSGGVADPNFSDPSAHYPFGWGLVTNGSISAERTLSGSRSVLSFRATPPSSGQLAAQLLTLASGHYALVVKSAAQASGAAAYWSVACGEAGGAEIARLHQPAAANAQANMLFAVPNHCAGQWLTLRLQPAPDSSA